MQGLPSLNALIELQSPQARKAAACFSNSGFAEIGTRRPLSLPKHSTSNNT